MTKRSEFPVGSVFCRLTVPGEAEPYIKSNGERIRRLQVQCSCGEMLAARASHLKNGNTRSCGCLQRERARATSHATHGMSKTPIYKVWDSMTQRCTNPNDAGFPDWGGRGIKICERWRSFENFLADMGFPPKGMSLDRIDNHGDYEPGNCRWTDRKTQCRNRRSTRFVMVNGEELTVTEAASRFGIDISTIGARSKRMGISYQEAADYYASRCPAERLAVARR